METLVGLYFIISVAVFVVKGFQWAGPNGDNLPTLGTLAITALCWPSIVVEGISNRIHKE